MVHRRDPQMGAALTATQTGVAYFPFMHSAEVLMRRFLAFVMLVLMTTVLAAGQSAPFISDPKQIVSQQKAQVQAFDLEKLYLTRSVGATTWSPDGKQIVFVTNISGRNNIWLVPASGGWPVQLTVSNQRQTAPAWSPDGKSIAYMSDY